MLKLIVCCANLQDLVNLKQVRVERITPTTYVPAGVFTHYSMTYAHIKYCMFCGKELKIENVEEE